VTFGGRAYQWITIAYSTFSNLTAQGVDVGLGAKAVFDLVAFGGTLAAGTTNTTMFQNATAGEQEEIQFCGGTPNTDLNVWFSTVKEDPAPVGLSLTPLSELLDATFFPQETRIAVKKRLLEAAIAFYIRSNGEASDRNLIRYGDTVVLENGQISGGCLCNKVFVFEVLDDASSPVTEWEIRNPNNLSSTELIKTGDTVVLYDPFSKTYLDFNDSPVYSAMPAAYQSTDPGNEDTHWIIYSGFDYPLQPLPKLRGRYVHNRDRLAFAVKLLKSVYFLVGTKDNVIYFPKPIFDLDSQWIISRKE
jgi:hypothetical protein